MREDVDIVIITAIDKERNAVLSYLPNPERVVNKNRIYYRSKLYAGGEKHLDIVLLSLPYMGNINASIATTRAIEVWNPRYIILTGITGGFKKEGVHLGDLIVAEQTVYYEYGKQNEESFSNRFLVQPSSMELLNVAHDYQSNDWFFDMKAHAPATEKLVPRVHFGAVATGEKVIGDPAFGDNFLKSWPKALGVEMEGYGAALAAFQSETRPGFLLIKSICDWADSSKNDDWQIFSAHAAASYTIHLLKFLLNISFDWKKDRPQAKKSESNLLTGKNKICICRNLLDDWYDLADYFEIPMHHRKRFIPGRECQGIWEWLEARGKLEALLEALKYLEREDLLRCLNESQLLT